jgi:hypothetical protein
MITDKRVVYGANCTFWGSINEIGTRDVGGHKLPCCPHCKGMLFEMDSEEKWFQGVDRYSESHVGYRDKIEWARGKCFKTVTELTKAYECREVS